ncbi:arylsulfatase [Pacificimonas sp. ICDLI1SI03]
MASTILRGERKKMSGQRRFYLSLLSCFIVFFSAPLVAQQRPARTVQEAPPPQWPERPRAPEGAPNVLLIMTDDVGFGASSTFGGPIPTPALDSIAERGLRFNRYHNSAMCSPTRAALLTGRNPHQVGMGATPQRPAGYPGYTSVIPDSAATVARWLTDGGYNTAMFGKSHLVPEWEMSATGPFDRWPTGMGFQYFYGFLSADTSQFEPGLFENLNPIDVSDRGPDYILDQDLADKAIAWIGRQREVAPQNPFFVYYAPGSAHTPHHAPKDWLEKFRGEFDEGWDVVRERSYRRQLQMGVIPADARLAPRPDQLPAWSSLSPDKQKVAARLMEAYAASLSFADAQIGRIIQELKDRGEFDNTMIIFIQGDNGGSAEGSLNGLAFEQSVINRVDEPFDFLIQNIDKIGGPDLYTNYPAAWGWALNSPFPWYKQIASHLGGVRNGLAISWPDRIKKPGLREQFLFVSDVAPTIMDAANLPIPETVDGVEQKPVDGLSFLYTIDDAGAESRRQRQVFEVFTNLGIYDRGWWAGTSPARPAWDVSRGAKIPVSERNWELYNLAEDYSQTADLAKRHPEKLEYMKDLFWAEAEKSNILPVRDALEGVAGKPVQSDGRTSFVYQDVITRVPESAAPPTIGKSWRITADIELGDDPANGVLVTQGGKFGGYALYLINGQPVFTYNAIPPRVYSIRSEERIGAGRHRLEMHFAFDGEPSGGGDVTLSVDGRDVASGRVGATLPIWISHTDGFDVGTDTITAINDDYRVRQSDFSGNLRRLEVRIEEEQEDEQASL